MKTRISGRVWKYGDDVNTDVIFPGKYTYSISDRKEMAKHALEDLEPSFVETCSRVTSSSRAELGYGSSRAGGDLLRRPASVTARSFALYYRTHQRRCLS
jgi:3-isopropylmalate/(R)-2-methylmalate dehydratase small subunit